jgi:hypothetical protein
VRVEPGICFLCLQSVISGTLPVVEYSQEDTAFVFRVESGIYFLSLQVESGKYFISIQVRIRKILPLSSG